MFVFVQNFLSVVDLSLRGGLVEWGLCLPSSVGLCPSSVAYESSGLRIECERPNTRACS